MEKLGNQFGDIVAQRLKALGTNAYALETAKGLPPDAIRNAIRSEKRSGPTLSRVQEICDALGLELYIGPQRDHGPQPPDADLSAYAGIPLHDALLAAGNGVENATEDISEHMAFRKDWLRKVGVAPSNAALARARGDSMQPCIWDGDMLLIDRSKVEPPLIGKAEKGNRSAPVFALLDDGQAKVKRLQLLDHGVAMMISDNPDYAPQFAKAETIHIIGKVIWWGHTSRD